MATAAAVLLLAAAFWPAFAATSGQNNNSQGTSAPTNESWSSCTALLCIDAPPQGPKGLDGSGGWGWDNKASAPVTSLTVGKVATFTVTLLQPQGVPLCAGGGSYWFDYPHLQFTGL
jgi:hypothetical protein